MTASPGRSVGSQSAHVSDHGRDRISEMLSSRALAYLNLSHGREYSLRELVAGTAGRTATSRLFQITSGDVSRLLWTKTYPASKGPISSATTLPWPYQREVSALKELESLFTSHAAYRVPRLLDAWDDLNTIVIEHIDAKPVNLVIQGMLTRFTSAPNRMRTLTDLYQRIGRWLGALHNGTYSGFGAFDSIRAHRLATRLERLLTGEHRLTRTLATRILRCSRQLTELLDAQVAVPTALYPIARSHGDFTLGNLMMIRADGPIWGVDFSGSRREPVYLDLMRCIVSLRTARRRAPSLSERAIERAILVGYAREVRFPLHGRRTGLRLFGVYSYLLNLAQFLERRPGHRSPALAAFWRILESQWVSLKCVRPMEVMLASAMRVLSQKRHGQNDGCRSGFDRADRYRGQAAKQYDTKRHGSFYGRLYQRANEAAVNSILRDQFGRCIRILDIPCGTGRMLSVMERLGAYVVAADISPDMVVEALGKNRSEQTTVRFVITSVQGLPFRDKAFDCVVCIKLLHLLPSAIWGNILRDLRRVSSRYVAVTVPVRNHQIVRRIKGLLGGRRIARRQVLIWERLVQTVELADLRIETYKRTIPIVSDEVILLLRRVEK